MRKIITALFSELGRILLGIIFFIPAFVLEKVGYAGVFPLPLVLYILAMIIAGYPVFIDSVRGILRGDLLDEKFLMTIASIGAMVISEYSEGVAVMLFYLVGEYFEHRAVAHSRKSIRALMDIRPDEATVLENGEERRVDVEDVAVGAEIVVRTGERVPLDALVLSGCADIDTSALTGESVPRAVSPSDSLDSGVVVLSGTLVCKTLRPAEESAAARVLELVENASDRKSREETFITAFSRFYTPIVVGTAVLLAIILPIFNITSWGDAIYRSLIFLVISCPCALVISVPMAFFGGIGAAASRGILFKGGNVFSPLAKADVFAFDKTGTLTSGEFSVSEIRTEKIPKDELLLLAASAEYGSNHPIARCLKAAAPGAEKPDEERELPGRGIVAKIGARRVAVGNRMLMEEIGITLPLIDFSASGFVFVSVDGEYSGAILLSDCVKEEAKASLSALRARKTVMLSGDRRETAEKAAARLGIDEAFGELSPEEKYQKLEDLIAEGNGKTVYVGDGINDAPCIARADVGIAMGAIGSDSAIEAADVVMMTDALGSIPKAIAIARKTLRIAKENIVFALGVKIAVLLLGALGLLGAAGMWLAVFADVGVAVIAILNAMRALRVRD